MQSSTKEVKKWPRQADYSTSDEYYLEYIRIVDGSDGFISFSDPISEICGGIRPYTTKDEYVKLAAAFAVEEHKIKTGANIKLKKIIKVNIQAQGRLVFYLTLELLEGDETVIYEAKVFQDMDWGHEVTIFRKAIYYNVNIEDLELKPHSSTKRTAERYGSEDISLQKRAFFDAHKDEEWLKNKYHPTNLLGVIERRNERARKTAKEFLFYLSRGIIDLSPRATAFYSSISRQTGEPSSNDEAADGGGKRRKHDKEGQDGESEISLAPKVHPVSSLPRRIQSDIEQARALVQKLDIEKGIEDNVLCNINFYREFNCGSMVQVLLVKCLKSDRILYGIKLLDALLTYLWHIHGVDYYGIVESDEPKGFRHVRPDDNRGEGSWLGAEWEKKLDSFWEKRLRGQDPLEAMTCKEKIDAADIEALDPYVRKIDDENNGWKYGCEAKGCTELFHCAEFVRDHLKLKHPELVMELTSKVREDLYFHNYTSYPDALGGKFHLPLQSAVSF